MQTKYNLSSDCIDVNLTSNSGSGMYSRLTRRLLAASSNSWGRLVAPITRIRSSSSVVAPSYNQKHSEVTYMLESYERCDITDNVISIHGTSCTKNSVLILLLLSCSVSLLWLNRESISSINITAGWWHLEEQGWLVIAANGGSYHATEDILLWSTCLATANNVRTNFSLSPIHFEVKDEALMLKNVELDWEAIHFPAITFYPVTKKEQKWN